MLKYAAALAIVFAAGPVLAQGGAAQSPPAPQAGSAQPQSSNSLPVGASNGMSGSHAAGSAIGGTTYPNGAVQAPGGPGNAQSTTLPKPQSR